MFECELTVTGPNDRLQKFKAKAEGESPPEIAMGILEFEPTFNVLNFHSLNPIPDKLLPLKPKYDIVQKEWLQKEWGCLGAADTRITCDEPCKLVYRFRTMGIPSIYYSPGIPVYLLVKVSKIWGTLEFLLQFEDASSLKAGRMSVFNGKGHTNHYPAYICATCRKTPLVCGCHAQSVVPMQQEPKRPVASGNRRYTKIE